MYVLRLAVVLIFIVGTATSAFHSVISYDTSDIIISTDDKKPCKATRECSNCTTSRLCIPVKDEYQQVALIDCNANPSTPYCDSDTGLCTSVAPNECTSEDFICPEADGTYPDPSSCDKYHICVNRYRITNVCPTNNVYDHALGDCRLRRSATDCVVQNCKGQDGKIFVYPKDDRIYGTCVNGKPFFIGRCKSYERYDVNLNKCVRVCRGVGNQPAEKCQQYVRCAETSRGKYEPVVQNCPCNKGFDENIGACSSNATCMKDIVNPCKLPSKVPSPDDKEAKDKPATDPKSETKVSGFIINNSNNNKGNNDVSNGNDKDNGNIVNGNNNGNNKNSGNVANSRAAVLIINNSDNSHGNNNVSNGNDSDNGNIVNGNGNSNNENKGDVGNVKPSRPRFYPFINNAGSNNGSNNVSNGDDSSNNNIINGNNNDNNENNDNVGNVEVSKPGFHLFIINNSNNKNTTNKVSNGNDSNNGNIVNGNGNKNNSNSGDVNNSNSRLAVLIINNSDNSHGNNKVSNGNDSDNGNIVNGNGNSNNENKGDVGNVKPSRPRFYPFINNSGSNNGSNNVSNGDDNSNSNIVNGNNNDNNENNDHAGNIEV